MARKSLQQTLKRLGTGSAAERAKAAFDLQFFERERDLRIRALIAALDDRSSHVRGEAAWALAQLYPPAPEATPHFIRLLSDSDRRTRQAAINGLVNMKPIPVEAALPLIAVFDDVDADAANDAIRTVGVLGEAGKVAVPRLIQALRDPRHSSAASQALASLGARAVAAVPELCRAIRSREPHTRIEAARALGEIGPPAVEAVPALLALVDDERFLARVEAQWAAREARHADPRSTIGVYPTTAGSLRAEAALALWLIAEHERAVPVLLEGMTDENRGGRRAAAGALRRIGPPATRAAAVLAQAACCDPDSCTRADSLEALFAFGPKALPVMGAMIYALDDEDWSVRSAAIEALGHLGPAARSAVDRLWRIAGDVEDPNLCAVRAIWQIDRDPATIDYFVSGLAIEVEECRQRCAEWLGEIGPPAARALPALQARLADDDELVIQAVARAIERITGASTWN